MSLPASDPAGLHGVLASLRRSEHNIRYLRVLALDRLRALLGLVPRNAVYCGNNRVLLRTAHGHRMYVDSRGLSVAPWLISDGVWEPWVARAILRMLGPGMRVVEVGANVGYFSVLMGHAIGPAGRLTTVEANPYLADIVPRPAANAQRGRMVRYPRLGRHPRRTRRPTSDVRRVCGQQTGDLFALGGTGCQTRLRPKAAGPRKPGEDAPWTT
jgi:hypothetical protein